MRTKVSLQCTTSFGGVASNEVQCAIQTPKERDERALMSNTND